MSNSFVDLCLEESIENSKCVVSQFRTTVEQKNAFEELLVTCKRTHIPIEWVIDIADESNGWFYGTAYHYDDITKMLHVMVPDKTNSSFDGQVILDYRTVHLIECVDGKSDALFNKIVRDSIIKIKWELEWFEEDVDEHGQVITDPDMNDEPKGKWVPSAARYFIRMANQLLVEDKNITTSTSSSTTTPTTTTTENTTVKGYVMLTADLNVKLITCSRNRGLEDFNRLVTEGITAYSDEAYETVMLANEMMNKNNNGNGNNGSNSNQANNNNPTMISIRKLTDISSGLKDSVTDLLEEREKLNKERLEFATFFQSFTMNGDLDSGLKLMNSFEFILSLSSPQKHDGDNKNKNNDTSSSFNALADETTFHMQKLEKGMVRLLQQQSMIDTNTTTNNNNTANTNDEMESLRKMQKQMKLELEERDREIKLLKSTGGNGMSGGSETSGMTTTTTPQKPPKSPRNENGSPRSSTDTTAATMSTPVK